MSEQIRNKIRLHIANVFKIPLESVGDDMEFGIDLKPSFVSDFKYNELDILMEDIRDACACSRDTSRAWNKGEIVAETVGEYINYMVWCYNENPKLVSSMLE